jgi:hypothetical protein
MPVYPNREPCLHLSIVRRARPPIVFCALALGVSLIAGLAHAGDPKALAAQLSDRAFALLDSLNKQSNGGSTNPLLPQMAIFAGDAQTLSSALAKGDIAAASDAIGTLQSDRANTDAAIGAHPGALDAAQWNGLKQQLDEIARQIQPTGVKPVASSASIPAAPPVSAAVSPPPAAAPPPAVSAGSSPGPDKSGPKVVIESRTREGAGNVVRIKGYFEGYALKSSGLYENGRLLRSFKVNDVPGDQRVSFDLGLGDPSPDTLVRVTDANGHFAEAPVLDLTASAPGSSLPPVSGETAPPGPLASAGPSDEAGVEVFRHSGDDGATAPGGSGGDGANTKEIPTHGPPVPSPSKRHTLGGRLGSVQINVMGLTQLETMPPTYDVVGQISGGGVTRAGIYVDGRLIKEIPIEDGGSFTSFDQRFAMNGAAATIRAYGVGDQFVESSLDLSSGTGVALSPGEPMAPQGPAIQITGVRPFASNMYVVTGVISGRNLSSAGLYQNGMLTQNISVGGLLGGILGALTPGTYRNTTFTVQFNPSLGPATVRAFDSSGAYTEQPIMAGGVSPFGSNPYAGANPYGMPMNPYGMSANPYYGMPPTSPYSTYPYANPYGARPAPPPSSRPLW